MPIPMDGYRAFDWKVRNFPEEVYEFGPNDKITQLMWTMLEDPGVGQLKKMQALAYVQEHLSGTAFSDLDQFFGAWLRFARLPDEQYNYDCFSDQLTQAQWIEVQLKDASYRNRISMFGQALMRGGTNEGIAMAAEAACGWPCQVVEVWRYTTGVGIGEIGRLNAAKEVVIVPLTDDLSLSETRAIYHIIDRLKPANIFTTVDDQGGLAVQNVISVRHATAASEYYEVRKYVAPQNLPNPIPKSTQVWIKANAEVEAPTHAYMATTDTEWSLNESIPTIGVYQQTPVFSRRLGSTVNGMGPTGDEVNVYWENNTPPPLPYKVAMGGLTGERDPRAWTFTSPIEVIEVHESYESHNGSEATWRHISRGADGTTPVGHPPGTPFYIQEVPAPPPPPPPPPPGPGGGGEGWGPWREFALADSSDNYASGKYSGDPSKYDVDGDYVFEWDSQAQFVTWWSREVIKIGGEVANGRFRLPIAQEPGLVTEAHPEDSLAAPEMTVSGTFFPRIRGDDE